MNSIALNWKEVGCGIPEAFLETWLQAKAREKEQRLGTSKAREQMSVKEALCPV